MSNSDTINRPELWLPKDPFPYPFQEQGLKPVLRDYLKVLRKHPAYAESTHSALVRLIAQGGVDEVATAEARRLSGNEDIIAFNTVTQRFFGVVEPVYDILIGYGRQAQEGGRAHRKALIIPGAPGAGKSDFVNFLHRDVMRRREPVPYLKFSCNYCNPLNALYLAKVIAQTKANDIYDKTIAELVGIIDSLDLSGDSALNCGNANLAAVVARHGFAAGQELSSTDLATICMASEKDFVAAVCYGLDLPPSTVDALSPSANLIDPYVKDAVLGRFFGKFGPKAPALNDFDESLAAKGKGQSKSKKHETYGLYDERYACPLAEYPLDNMFMSKGEGLRDLAEVEPINFDLDVSRGRKSLVNMGQFDSEDPRSVDLNGVFNKAKSAVITEIFRNPIEFFRVLFELLEGGRVPLPEPLDNYHPEGIHWEGILIGHANDEQWEKFYGNLDHRAQLDRFSPKPMNYPLQPAAAARITEKLYAQGNLGRPSKAGGVHHEPLSFTYSGYFRVATHIDWPSKGNRPFLAVLRAYDGKEMRENMMGQKIDLRALREEAPITEGHYGMSPREMDDVVGQLAAEAKTAFERGERPAACFTTAELRNRLKLTLRNNRGLAKKDRALWTGWLDNELEELRRKELTKVYKAAFIPNFRDLCIQLVRKYTQYVRALALGIKPTKAVGGHAVTQRDMEGFLQEIERADEYNVNSAQAQKFRGGVMAAINLYNEMHGSTEPPYEAMPEGLRTCIESYVLRQMKDITGIVGVTNLSEEQQKQMDSAKARLMDPAQGFNYCEYCAQKLLLEVALNRDFLKA